MRYIVRGGITTKNIPPACRDAIELATKLPDVFGIELGACETKDKEVVVYCKNNQDITKEEMKGETLYYLRRRNIASGVRNHQVLTLEEALKSLDRSNCILVLSLEEQTDVAFLKKVIEITGNFPNLNIYIKSDLEDVVEYIRDLSGRQRTGINMCYKSNELWQVQGDFYSMNSTCIEKENMKRKIGENRRIMINDIDTKDEMIRLEGECGCNDSIYVITDSIYNVMSANLGE